MKKILFVCTGNTCRSVIAEALAKRRFGDSVDVKSAGIRLQQPGDAANAIYTLKTYFDLDVSGHMPRDVTNLRLEEFDYVIVMDKEVARLIKKIYNSKLIVWKIDDPYGDDLDEYRQCALKVMQEVSRLQI